MVRVDWTATGYEALWRFLCISLPYDKRNREYDKRGASSISTGVKRSECPEIGRPRRSLSLRLRPTRTKKRRRGPSVEETLDAFPDKVAAYRAGKKGLMGFFMGQVMQRTGGTAKPELARKLLEERLGG